MGTAAIDEGADTLAAQVREALEVLRGRAPTGEKGTGDDACRHRAQLDAAVQAMTQAARRAHPGRMADPIDLAVAAVQATMQECSPPRTPGAVK
jgi:hypothetical protein